MVESRMDALLGLGPGHLSPENGRKGLQREMRTTYENELWKS